METLLIGLIIVAYLTALISLIPYIKKLLDLFIKTPEEKRKEFLGDLNSAFKKAEDPIDPDPTDLSKLINKRLR